MLTTLLQGATVFTPRTVLLIPSLLPTCALAQLPWKVSYWFLHFPENRENRQR